MKCNRHQYWTKSSYVRQSTWPLVWVNIPNEAELSFENESKK